MKAWLRFFRVVNLPTVPGDVLAGAAVVIASEGATSGEAESFPLRVAATCVASVFLYMFGLADNDIVGVKTDKGRPIADGQISLGAARWARGLCVFAALIIGSLANLPATWWVAAFLLVVAIAVYNRMKLCLVMGLCRGLNVLCGGAVFCASLTSGKDSASPLLWTSACVAVWTIYITFVTWYSAGEETDPEKKRRVGFLIGAIVYLQLIVLLIFRVDPLLLTGAALLVVLRLMKRFLPEVSAS